MCDIRLIHDVAIVIDNGNIFFSAPMNHYSFLNDYIISNGNAAVRFFEPMFRICTNYTPRADSGVVSNTQWSLDKTEGANSHLLSQFNLSFQDTAWMNEC